MQTSQVDYKQSSLQTKRPEEDNKEKAHSQNPNELKRSATL